MRTVIASAGSAEMMRPTYVACFLDSKALMTELGTHLDVAGSQMHARFVELRLMGHWHSPGVKHSGRARPVLESNASSKYVLSQDGHVEGAVAAIEHEYLPY